MSARRLLLLPILIALSATAASPQSPPASLVILRDSGQTREGLPILLPDPDAAPIAAVLMRGYSGRLLRLYALEQDYLHRKTGQAQEPAYLARSDHQGGFPKFGFYLGELKKSGAGWVDLQRSSRLSGSFGAMDQIFPHELLHVIVRQLAGEPRRSGANQIHAVGVKTDPVVAFNEGFAEHAQIMAVDDPDAMPDTSALPNQPNIRARADREIAAYARELERRWWPIPASRLRFLLWFSAAEQVQRYFAVKDNLFARVTPMPDTVSDPYRAYLYQSVVPGPAAGPLKSAGAVLSTDGGVAHLFWKLITDDALQRRYRDAAFYDAFGVSQDTVSPLENVYLKLFAVLHDARPSTTVETMRAWARMHPDDAADVARIVTTALGQPLPDAPELWLANDDWMTGSSLFDQFRVLPRMHTFDANAALPIDWMTVPGMTPDVASRLAAAAPYPNFDALLESTVLSPTLRERIHAMAAAARARIGTSAQDDEESLSVSTLAVSYLWRVAAIVVFATAAGAWLARVAGVRRYFTAAAMALAATALVIAFAWVIESPMWYHVVAPIVVGGMPWALWRLGRERRPALALNALLAWAAASVPAIVITMPF